LGHAGAAVVAAQNSAGRGIVHSEMPEQEDGLMWGFQLWVNLPARLKMTKPRYQDIEPQAIPVVALPGGATVRLITGRIGAVEGPVREVATEPLYLDVALPAGAGFAQPVPFGHAAFAYVYDGAVTLGEGRQARRIERGELAVLGPGETVVAEAGAEAPGRFILVAGRPLNEPVVKYGPFVMNSEDEIRQAVLEYRAGRF
jgi:redox-sensitive bicupin YhaK (pirin superfamily)